MKRSFESLPRRIFLDSCTAQTLRDYGCNIYEAEPIADTDRIRRVTDGVANVEALRCPANLPVRCYRCSAGG
jgi:hypothetical protein